MKTKNLFISVLLIIVLTSVSFATTPIGENHGQTVDMQCSVVSETVFIKFTNPLQKDLTITVSTMEGQLLKIENTNDRSGQFKYKNSDLVRLGGSGSYQIVLYANDKKRKVETVVVVITAE